MGTLSSMLLFFHYAAYLTALFFSNQKIFSPKNSEIGILKFLFLESNGDFNFIF